MENLRARLAPRKDAHGVLECLHIGEFGLTQMVPWIQAMLV